MKLISTILIAIVVLEHLYFLWMEMFAWETTGKKTFGGSFPENFFVLTKKLAANQGLYNGFLAAGLIWTFFIENPVWQTNIAAFFLCCVLAAGIFGGITTSRKILFVQGVPALAALIFLLIS